MADVWCATRIGVASSLNKALSQGFTGNTRREFGRRISQVNNAVLEGQHDVRNWYLEGFP